MKALGRLFLVLLLIAMLILAACGNSATIRGQNEETSNGNQHSNEETQNSDMTAQEPEQEVITLKMADAFPTTHIMSQEAATFWMERIEELTQGQVQIEYFPAEQMGKASSLLDIVKSGVTDIAYTPPNYTSDKTPLGDIASLPGGFSSSVQGTKAFWDIANGILLEEEYLKHDVRPVFVGVSPPYQVSTIDKKILNVSDFKGVKLRTSGGAQEITVSTLGATPVSIPAPDTYTALERKTVDGAVFPLTSWKGYQLEKLFKYSTTNAKMGSSALPYVINEQVYQNLPENVQEAVVQAGEETVDHISHIMDEEVTTLIGEFQATGIDMYELSAEQLVEWDAAVETIWDEWINSLEEKGLPAAEVVQQFQEAVEKY